MTDANTKTPRLSTLRMKLRLVTLTVYTCSLVLDVLNSTGVTFAIDDIASHYGISESTANWTLSAYALIFGAFLSFSGRLGILIYLTLLHQEPELTLFSHRRRTRTQESLCSWPHILCSFVHSYGQHSERYRTVYPTSFSRTVSGNDCPHGLCSSISDL